MTSFVDFIERLVARFFVVVAHAHFGIVNDRHEHVVEFVRSGADEFSQRRHSLRLIKLLFEGCNFVSKLLSFRFFWQSLTGDPSVVVKS